MPRQNAYVTRHSEVSDAGIGRQHQATAGLLTEWQEEHQLLGVTLDQGATTMSIARCEEYQMLMVGEI